MKKLLSINLATLLSITIFMLSCNDKNVKQIDDNQPDDNNYSKIKPPKKIIPVETSINLFKRYDTIKTKVIEPVLRKVYQNPDFKETQFVWYSLEDIKEYISYIEKVKKANPKYNVTGLRFYYGAYSGEQQSAKYPNQQTFFMVPTMKSNKIDREYNTMNHIPFYIEYEKGSNPIKGEFVAIDELMLDYNKKERLKPYLTPNISSSMSAILAQTTMTSLVFNEGEACPPPYRER